MFLSLYTYVCAHRYPHVCTCMHILCVCIPCTSFVYLPQKFYVSIEIFLSFKLFVLYLGYIDKEAMLIV